MTRYTDTGTVDSAELSEASETLEQAVQLRLARLFTSNELRRTRTRAWDTRIADALDCAGKYGLAEYLARPDHTRNWLRHGFTEDDLAGGGSDRLVAALVAGGPVERVARRLREHHQAGADHVAVQVVGAPDAQRALRDIAAALAG